MKSVVFKLNVAGGADILRNNPNIRQIEEEVFTAALSDISAKFFQTFGVEGSFELVEFTTDRTSSKIRASDARTATILRANPKWLDQFIVNMKI